MQTYEKIAHPGGGLLDFQDSGDDLTKARGGVIQGG